MSSNTDDLGNVKTELSDGSALFAIPYEADLAAKSIKQEIRQKTDTELDSRTPDPTAGDEGVTVDPRQDGGPLRRFTDIKSPLGLVGLESLAKDEDEIAKAISARSDEIYRNEFPVIRAKFEARCETCGAEFDDEDLAECEECGADTLTPPDPRERREIKDLFQSVNKEGQSMRQLGKITDEDHSRLGVLVWVLRWQYLPTSQSDAPLSTAMAVGDREFKELVRGDPKRIVPVVDANGRIGGVWWTCPFHREEGIVTNEEFHEGHATCEVCGCDLREVQYVELAGAAGERLEKYFFEHEIVMHAGHIPQAHGLDGLSPVHLVWLEQAILHWMDVYAAEYFNPHSEKTPGKFIIFHTSNPAELESSIEEAKDDMQASPHKGRTMPTILYDRIMADQSADSTAEIIDVIDNDLIGQSEDLRKRYENHIRTVFGVTDVFDSELEDAGGLNNEGLQIEVTDRSIAAAQQDYTDGPYDDLLRYLGYEDWKIRFVPPRERDLDEQRKAVRLLREAAEIGLPARMENGEPVIGDGDADAMTQGGMDGDRDPSLDVPPPEPGGGDESGNRSADDVPADEALRQLTAAQQHLTWTDLDDDTGQKAADPFWDADEDMPAFVKRAIRAALRAGAVAKISDELAAGVTERDVESFFRDQLTQPQGWSIRSLTENYADRFGVPEDDAVTAVRTQTTNILNTARAEGYAQQGDADDRSFKWLGPGDDDTTDACRWLKAQTNPDHGGTPRSLSELEGLVAEANREYFPEFDGGEYQPHWQCRHTFVEHFD